MGALLKKFNEYKSRLEEEMKEEQRYTQSIVESERLAVTCPTLLGELAHARRKNALLEKSLKELKRSCDELASSNSNLQKVIPVDINIYIDKQMKGWRRIVEMNQIVIIIYGFVYSFYRYSILHSLSYTCIVL